MTAFANPSSEGAPDRIVAILEDYLRELERGVLPDRQAILRAHPDCARELEGRLSMLEQLHSAAVQIHGADVDGTRELLAVGERLGDHTIVREIDRGGMGIVYEAHQLSLDRRVALKVLPFASALGTKRISRFRTEVRSAARLHHSNIVPVYSVGSERGVHYFAMQFIDGHSLADEIDSLRSDRRAGSADSRGPRAKFFRRVARWGAQAASALEHAHGRGVVHRDIKPSNLLIDTNDQLWVTDFGLARMDSDGSVQGLTMTGDLLGTLRYMSPEQAEANRAPVDQRTDIYSLGATLYELLALETASTGETPQALLASITNDEPRALRRIDPAIPVELETILQKAMQRKPTDRYATAQDLADDFERFLRDEPIRARRPSMTLRVRKWAKRHKDLILTCSVLLVMAVVALSVSTALIWQEQEKTSAALNSSEREFSRAERNFERALDAVEEMLKIGSGELAAVPGAAEVRERMLTRALTFYLDLLSERDTRLSRLDLAHATRVIAQIRVKIGMLEQAEVDCREALELCNSASPGFRARIERGAVQATLARVLRGCGRPAEAERAHRDAIRVWEQCLRESPDNHELRSELVRSYQRLGVALRHQSRTDDADSAFRAALATLGFDSRPRVHQVPLAYNFNGIVHAGEGGDPDDPMGFRSISDRALDFRAGIPDRPMLQKYLVVDSPRMLDIVYLGDRRLVDDGSRGFDTVSDGDEFGVQPSWLQSPAQLGPHVSQLVSPIGILNSSRASFLVQASNGGSAFDVTFVFENGEADRARIYVQDWFGGDLPGTESTDLAVPGPGLHLYEHTIDLGAYAGELLTRLVFSRPSNPSAGCAIVAANVSGTITPGDSFDLGGGTGLELEILREGTHRTEARLSGASGSVPGTMLFGLGDVGAPLSDLFAGCPGRLMIQSVLAAAIVQVDPEGRCTVPFNGLIDHRMRRAGIRMQYAEARADAVCPVELSNAREIRIGY